jgi:DNA-binding LacI/PurR family transcriptional regulator
VPHSVWLDSTVWHEHNCIQRDEVAAGEYAGRALAEAGYRKWIYMDRPIVRDHITVRQVAERE